MKLENQVVSLEIAKKLKELGVKQESLFWWVLDGVSENGWSLIRESFVFTIGREYLERYSAFTVAELGEMLPNGMTSSHTSWEEDEMRFQCSHYAIEQCDECHPLVVEPTKKVFYADTEADARGKMLMYLLENNLIDKNSL